MFFRIKQIGLKNNVVCYFCALFAFVSQHIACSDTNISLTDEVRDVGVPKACIMIVPDIQNYTHIETRFKYLCSIADYYNNNKDSIDAVLQVGDLTNNNAVWQYENAYNYFFSKFDKYDQLVFCLGNHDYGNNGSSDIRMSNFPDSMMPPYDLRMEDSKWENYVRFINIGGEKYGVVVLEFCTKNETLDWANDVIKAESQIPFIILTHVFLNDYGEMFDYTNKDVSNGGSNKYYQMQGDYKNDSREIFEKLIYNNPNVKFVICGHCLTPSYINVNTQNNAAGKPVHMIMVNYQHYAEGGLGCVGLLYLQDGLYRIRSFSTYKEEFTGIDISFGDNN